MNHNCKYIIIFKWIITVNISFVENESSNITYHNIKTNLIIKYIVNGKMNHNDKDIKIIKMSFKKIYLSKQTIRYNQIFHILEKESMLIIYQISQMNLWF